jgi:hypothetical protein
MRNPITRIGAKLKKSEARNEVVGTFTFHAFEGGLLVNNSVICGS